MPSSINGEFAVFDHATKRYGGHVALSDCSLAIREGEVLGIAGSNGAGKSTMAKLLMGFTLPSSGTVTVTGGPPVQRRRVHGIGYAPEEASRPWRVTLRELLGIRRVPKSAAMTPEHVVDVLGLQPLLDKRIDRLSKGQWRMCLIAYAVVGSSSLLVLDEPDSGLDPTALDRLQAIVSESVSNGSTVVMLSHNLDELERACDRIMVIHGSKVAGSFPKSQFATAGMRNIYRSVVA